MKAIHVYNQSMVFDIRTRRYAQALVGFYPTAEVLLLGQQPGDEKEEEVLSADKRSRIVRLKYAAKSNKLWAHLSWLMRVFKYANRQKEVRVISAHSLKVLPICVLLCLFKSKCVLLYDTHEIETHTTSNSKFIFLLNILERLCMSMVKMIIVTSPGHYEWYEKKYNKPVFLIRNTPGLVEAPAEKNLELKKTLGLSESDKLFLYIGMIAKRRGCEVILNSFRNVSPQKHILFLGYGDYLDELKEVSKELNNVHIMDPVPPFDLVRFISGADVGIHMMDDSNLNHKKALPNKPMQYMAAGLASIVSDVEVMSNLIIGAQSGIIVKVGDTQALQQQIDEITPESIDEFKAKANLWFEQNNWELESLKLKNIYDNFFEH